MWESTPALLVQKVDTSTATELLEDCSSKRAKGNRATLKLPLDAHNTRVAGANDVTRPHRGRRHNSFISLARPSAGDMRRGGSCASLRTSGSSHHSRPLLQGWHRWAAERRLLRRKLSENLSKPIKPTSRGKQPLGQQLRRDVIRFNPYQAAVLNRYHMHALFRLLRFVAFFVNLAATGITICSLASSEWIKFSDRERGLWQECVYYENSSLGDCLILPTKDWYKTTVILLSSCLLASLLSSAFCVTGAFSYHLVKVLYYFHSASEIMTTCAIAQCAGSVALLNNLHNISYSLGSYYKLQFLSAGLHLIASLFMRMDSIILSRMRAQHSIRSCMPGCSLNCCESELAKKFFLYDH